METRLARTIEIPASYVVMSVTPNGKLAIVLTPGTFRGVYAWCLVSNKILDVLVEGTRSVSQCTFSHDSRYMATSLSVIDLVLNKRTVINSVASPFAFTSAGNIAVVPKRVWNGVDIIDWRTGFVIRSIRTPSPVRDLFFFSETRSVLRCAHMTDTQSTWFHETDGIITELFRGNFHFESADLSPDTKHFAVGDKSGAASLFDTETWTRHEMSKFTNYIHYTKFSPDSRLVAFSSSKCVVTIVSVKYKTIVASLQPRCAEIVPWGVFSKSDELTLMTSPTTVSTYQLENPDATRILTVLAASSETSVFKSLVQKSGDGAVLERVRKWMDVVG